MENTGSATTDNYEIFFRKSTDGGGIFDDPVRISNTPVNSGFPSLAVSGRNVYIVWEERGIGSSDIFFSMSTDDGFSFSSPINLSNNLSVAAH